MATAVQTPVSASEKQSREQHTGTRIGPVTERTLVQLFLRQAASRGGNPAMFHRDGDHWAPIGWDDYATQARSLAAFFMSTGLLASERDEEELAAVTHLLSVQSLFNSPNGRRDGSKTRSLCQKGEASSHGNFKSLKASNPDGARTGCTLKE